MRCKPLTVATSGYHGNKKYMLFKFEGQTKRDTASKTKKIEIIIKIYIGMQKMNKIR